MRWFARWRFNLILFLFFLLFVFFLFWLCDTSFENNSDPHKKNLCVYVQCVVDNILKSSKHHSNIYPLNISDAIHRYFRGQFVMMSSWNQNEHVIFHFYILISFFYWIFLFGLYIFFSFIFLVFIRFFFWFFYKFYFLNDFIFFPFTFWFDSSFVYSQFFIITHYHTFHYHISLSLCIFSKFLP